MVVKCVAAGCSRTHSDGVSLFKFPKDPARRQEWTLTHCCLAVGLSQILLGQHQVLV